ncbi:hypothetical protein ENUP19_0314G0010 [Entamoeba nuttalli]|uniref:TLDc domain-containing protein n=1 Tax=Entamoeba nuttalli TaxID=412467 RepID=A0ABQ0DVT2_9EUKA
MNIDQYISYLKEWSHLSNTTILFDSAIDELTARNVYSKISGKTHIYFIVEDSFGNVFGSYHNYIPQQDETVGYEKDPDHFIFTLHNPHNTEPSKYEPNNNNNDLIHTYYNYGINNVLNIQHAYGITSNSKVFVYESIINYYINIPNNNPRLFTTTVNCFVNMTRLLIIEMN